MAKRDASESGDATDRVSRRGFNGLSPKEWASASRNVWNDLSSPRSQRHLEHGAVFPLKLAERLITLYTAEGDLVFDPFNGIGTTTVAASRLGRSALGIELNPKFAEMGREWLRETPPELGSTASCQIVTDDCRNLTAHLEAESVQLVLSSPPYADFIRRSVLDRERTHKTSRIVRANNSRVRPYSDDPRDFGNMGYDEFLIASEDLFASLLKVTRPGGYVAWIVKDHRLPPDRPYVSIHSDLASAAQRAGWLWHDLIIWDQNDQRRLILLGFPRRFYTNQNCSFVVVLRRED